MASRLSYDYVKEYIESFIGYILLSENYENNSNNLMIRCPKDHVFYQTYNRFLSGARCSECSGNKKLTIGEVRTYVESTLERGYKLISEQYVNAHTKLDIQCSNNHIFKKSFDSLKRSGTGCPFCSGLVKFTFKQVKNYIEIESETNYTLLSQNYVNNIQKLKMQCDKGHIFETSYTSFRNQGTRCPDCHLVELSKMMTGRPRELHPSFKSELTDEEREYKRNIIGYKDWVLSVFKRDRFVCQCCHQNNSGNLNAHHLDSYDWCVGKRTDVNNGITLCQPCHFEFHKNYGYGKNTREQFQHFLELNNENTNSAS